MRLLMRFCAKSSVPIGILLSLHNSLRCGLHRNLHPIIPGTAKYLGNIRNWFGWRVNAAGHDVPWCKNLSEPFTLLLILSVISLIFFTICEGRRGEWPTSRQLVIHGVGTTTKSHEAINFCIKTNIKKFIEWDMINKFIENFRYWNVFKHSKMSESKPAELQLHKHTNMFLPHVYGLQNTCS